jgi:hypothetical protein
MRAMIFGLFAAAFLSVNPLPAAASPATDNATSMQAETLSDHDRWQGRHHYLYDEEHPPGAETIGSAASDARACSNEPVRLKRSDGSTVVRRFKRCD